MVWIGNQPMKQLGIGLIRQPIASRTNPHPGIQIAVGKRLVRRSKPLHVDPRRSVDRLTLRTYSSSVSWFGTLTATSFSGAYFRQDKDKSGQRISPNARLLAVLIPIVLSGHLCHLCGQLLHVGGHRVRRHMAAMQKSHRIGECVEQNSVPRNGNP